MDLLAAVLERADAAIVACDATGRIVFFNAAARDVFGQVLPDDHPLFRSLREGALRGVEVVTAAGSAPNTVLVSSEQLLDSSGNCIGAVATCASLLGTDREQRQEAAEAHKRLELLLESTGEGIYGLDLDGMCTFVNGSAAAMLGSTREELLRKNVHALIHHTTNNGKPYSVEDCPIYRAFREGRGCRVDDECFFRLDGSSFPVEYSSYPILDAGVVRGAVVTFSDASARKRTEAALRASEFKYRSLFETVSEGVYQTSPNGELLAANRSLVEMLGYASEHELRAQDVTDLYVNPQERQRLTAQLEREGKLADVELLLKRKDGSIIKVIENARAIHDDRKRLIYYEGMLKLADGARHPRRERD